MLPLSRPSWTRRAHARRHFPALLTALFVAVLAHPARAAYDPPVSPNAMPEVATLLEFLGGLRGKYILSGQQEFPGWPDTIEIGQASDPDFKRIVDVTGKMPAVRGFDFLFYTHSAGGRATQRSTERAIEWWQQGGIVTFCVHLFMDIGSTDGTPKFYTPAAGGTGGGTTIDINQVVINGTPENIEYLAKLDIMAAELKILRDAGVPVIWRPLHECSGGWFWWGAKGVTPFKAAYRLMFERFTQMHGLNNLIWCYNPTDSGNALADWYPGDDVVDMISLDVYPPTGTHPTFASVYEQQYNLRSGRKVIAMTENGAIPDPDNLFTEGAYWAYFCTWNGSFIQDGVVNPVDFLQRVYTHPRVITRDELGAIMPRLGVAPTIAVQPQTATTGTGADLTLSVVARGSAPLAYQWRKDGATISGANEPALTLKNATDSDTAIYSVVVSNTTDSITSDAVAVTIQAPAFVAPPTALANLSTRARVGTDTRMMIAGFVVGGSGAKRVLIRAVGPTLAGAAFNVTGTIADPELVLTTQSGTVLASNDDWGTGQDATLIETEAARVGAFSIPAGSRDAALIVALPPGGYTALVRGVADQTGVAIVEVYDLDLGSPARLVNLSTRADVGEGDNVLIAGFVSEGTGSSDMLIRAVGPMLGLAPPDGFGLTGALADSRLNLSTPVAQNDDWGTAPNLSALTALTATVGAFPLTTGGKDAALLESVPIGACTATVTGPAGTSGIALAEIYIAPE